MLQPVVLYLLAGLSAAAILASEALKIRLRAVVALHRGIRMRMHTFASAGRPQAVRIHRDRQ